MKMGMDISSNMPYEVSQLVPCQRWEHCGLENNPELQMATVALQL